MLLRKFQTFSKNKQLAFPAITKFRFLNKIYLNEYSSILIGDLSVKRLLPFFFYL